MKDAMGSTVLFYIILGFIGVFIFFIAIIMEYAVTYRTNNYVVTAVEQSEGGIPYKNLTEDLKRRKYYGNLKILCADNSNGAVFQITTYIQIHIPIIFKEGEGLNVPITNDTKTIYNVFCGDSNVQSCGPNSC